LARRHDTCPFEYLADAIDVTGSRKEVCALIQITPVKFRNNERSPRKRCSLGNLPCLGACG
jgi:hypothetical protein